MIYKVTVEETVRRECVIEVEGGFTDVGVEAIKRDIKNKWLRNELDNKMVKIMSNGEQWSFNKLEGINIQPVGRVEITRSLLNACNKAFGTNIEWNSDDPWDIDEENRNVLNCFFSIWPSKKTLREHMAVSQDEFNNMKDKGLIKHINDECWAYFNKKIYECFCANDYKEKLKRTKV